MISFFRRFCLFFGAFLCLFQVFLAPVSAAQTPLESQMRLIETIRNFDVQTEVRADRSVRFQETIVYDFGLQWKHGIFRFIPTGYKRVGFSYDLRLKIESVLMDGAAVPWEMSSELNGLNVKIGDADKLIKGVHTYQIVYTTDRALNDFAEHQELYWNVTGNAWEVPIEQASFRVRSPVAASRTLCYTGVIGSQEKNCTVSSVDGSSEFKTQSLKAYQGLTVVVGFPYGAIHKLAWYERALQVLQDNLLLFVPVLVLIVMFFVWWKWGREPRGRGTIIPHYEEPNGLPPALLYALRKQHVGLPAVTATILDLARRGYLTVIFPKEGSKEGFILEKKHAADEKLQPFERTLFEGLFGGLGQVTLKEEKPGFWKVHQSVRDQVLNLLKERGWIRENPEAARSTWVLLAFLIVFGSFFLIQFSPAYFVVGLISAGIISLFGWQMPQKTKEGAILLEEIEGFKQFLSVTEKQRLAFTDAPAKTPEQFARFLPAAVALGVEDQWSKQFADLLSDPPDYIRGSSGAMWNMAAFNHSLHGLSSNLSKSMAAPASTAGGGGSGFSSGGGSGGGGGGGGGGSW